MLSKLDSDMKMAASVKFASILSEIQASNLNFKIELSSFSAVITLKKTAIKDYKGVLLSHILHCTYFCSRHIMKLTVTPKKYTGYGVKKLLQKVSWMLLLICFMVKNECLKHKLEEKIKVEENIFAKANKINRLEKDQEV